MLNSPADGISVSLPFGCKRLVRPPGEDLFINHANGPGRLSRPPARVPTFLEVGPHSLNSLTYVFNKGDMSSFI